MHFYPGTMSILFLYLSDILCNALRFLSLFKLSQICIIYPKTKIIYTDMSSLGDSVPNHPIERLVCILGFSMQTFLQQIRFREGMINW